MVSKSPNGRLEHLTFGYQFVYAIFQTFHKHASEYIIYVCMCVLNLQSCSVHEAV